MTDAISALDNWLESRLDLSSFKRYRGVWVADPANKTSRIIAFMQTGGGGQNISVRTQPVRVLILSAEKGQSDAIALSDFANSIFDTLEQDYKTCGVAQIRPIGGIIGPGLTMENRVWFEMTLQLTI